MPSLESAERTGGSAFLGLPAFYAFVWALDNYGRLELLVTLHDHLPAFLVNPVTSFVCMCIGMWLLYLSHQEQLKRTRTSRLFDSSGTEYRRNENAKWLVPGLLAFLIALITTPVIAVGYTLASKGNPPAKPTGPRPPLLAYEKTPPNGTPDGARQQQSRQNNAQTGPITQGPGSIAQVGGSGNTAIIGLQQRHLSPSQKESLISSLGQSPPGFSGLMTETGDTEGETYAEDFYAVFRQAGWDVGKMVGKAQGNPMPPPGLWIVINTGDPDAHPIEAERFAQKLRSAGLTVDFFAISGLPTMSTKYDFILWVSKSPEQR